MRRILRVLSALAICAALALTIFVGQSRPFTAFGAGTEPLPAKLQPLTATVKNLTTQLGQIEGARVGPTQFSGYNQGNTVRAITLCPTGMGVYSFTGSISLPSTRSDRQTIELAERQLRSFLGDARGDAASITLGGRLNLLSGTRLTLGGSARGSLLLNYNAHTIYLSGSADGCYPLAQLPGAAQNQPAGGAA